MRASKKATEEEQLSRRKQGRLRGIPDAELENVDLLGQKEDRNVRWRRKVQLLSNTRVSIYLYLKSWKPRQVIQNT